jgi:hypothetical protein
MPPTNEDLWRNLRVGDRIQIVHFPCEYSDREFTMHAETRAAYQYLIDSSTVLTIESVDADGYPWTEFEMVDEQGRVEHHYLMLNHDGLVHDQSIEQRNDKTRLL